jgi:hypothetical protein
MGTVVGGSRASLAAWTSPTALLAGLLFAAACGYLAAVYLVGEAERHGDRRIGPASPAAPTSPPSRPVPCPWTAWPNWTPACLYARLTGRV